MTSEELLEEIRIELGLMETTVREVVALSESVSGKPAEL